MFNGTCWKNYPEQIVGSGTVFDLDVDHNNNIWAGTTNGVSRFDGNNWTIYKISRYAGDIMVDQNNNIWAITPGKGVYMFDGTNWKTYTEKEGLVSDFVLSLAVDQNNHVWLGTEEGVSKYTPV